MRAQERNLLLKTLTEDSKEDLISKEPKQYRITQDLKEDPITVDPKEDPITVDPKEDPITVDPKEDPITVDIKEDLLLKKLKRTPSQRILKIILPIWPLRSFRNLNEFCSKKNSFWLFGDGKW